MAKPTATDSMLQRLVEKGAISQRTADRAMGKATAARRAKRTGGRRGLTIDSEGVTLDIGRPEMGPRLDVGKPQINYAHTVDVGRPQIPGREPIVLSGLDVPVGKAGRGAKIASQLQRGGRGILRAVDRVLPGIAGDQPARGKLLADLGGDHPGRVFQESNGKRFFVPQYGPLAGEPVEIRPGQSLQDVQDFAAGPPGQKRGVAPANQPPLGPQAAAAPPYAPPPPPPAQPGGTPVAFNAQPPLGAANTVGPLQGNTAVGPQIMATPEQQALAAALAARRA